jgi:hypothetical protein
MDLILGLVKLLGCRSGCKVKAAVKLILNHQASLALYSKHSPDLSCFR